mgnify:FL=1
MCGGGGNELDLTSEVKKDPLTRERESKLWAQSNEIAQAGGFESQYGPASSMPGMSDMSMAGQEYLTDSILGPGQYKSQNLGFGDYTRPETAPAPTREVIALMQEGHDADNAARLAAEAAEAARLAESFGQVEQDPILKKQMQQYGQNQQMQQYGQNQQQVQPPQNQQYGQQQGQQ